MLKKQLTNVDEDGTVSENGQQISSKSPSRAPLNENIESVEGQEQQNFQMLTSGGMNSDYNRLTVPRLKLNLNIGNITGVPSALGMTDGG